jgi:D-lactate dehydrogenase (cytochrome)
MVQALKDHFGVRFNTADSVREHHGRDESPYPMMLPDAVVYADSTDDVVFVVNQCRTHQVPLIPYGAGSSLEGHLLAIEGGISLDLSNMNQLLALHVEDLTVTVQPGIS